MPHPWGAHGHIAGPCTAVYMYTAVHDIVRRALVHVDLPACSRRAARVLGHGAGSRRPRTMWGTHARGLHRRETSGPFNVRNCKAQEPGTCKQLGGFEFDTLYGIGVHVPTTL